MWKSLYQLEKYNLMMMMKIKADKALWEAHPSIWSVPWIINRQFGLISQACSTQSRLIKATIRFMFSPQSYTNMTDINLHLVCDIKRASKSFQHAADDSFHPTASAFLSLRPQLFCPYAPRRTRRFSSLLSLFRWQIRNKVEATKRPRGSRRRNHRGVQLHSGINCQDNKYKQA